MHGKRLKELIKCTLLLLSMLMYMYAINICAEENSVNDSNSAEERDLANSWRYVNGTQIEIGDPMLGVNGISMYSMRPEEAKSTGIDVSYHQGTINWSQVKSNIDFAIIRCGYGRNTAEQDDKQWEANVSACERLGIPYGVYLYSYALNTTSAESEAEHALRLLKGHSPSLPVFYDLEDKTISNACSASQILEHTKIFCSKLQNAGYTPGVYANKYWWTTYLTSSVYDQWERWVAQYNTSCTYSGNHNYWQYTENGSVPGISGSVDMNYSRLTFGQPAPDPDPDEEIEYYPACSSSYTSLADALKSVGEDSSFSKRKEIAILNDIADYSGTASQNIQMLNLLKQGKLIKAKKTKTDPEPEEVRGSEMTSGYDRVLPDGNYIIASAANPQYFLDIEGGTYPAVNGTNVTIYSWKTELAKYDTWTITYQDGFYRITQNSTGMSLDVLDADTLQEKNVQVWGNNDMSAQKWAISGNRRNGYRIQAKCSGYSLDIAGGILADGTNVRQYSANDTGAQDWIFIPYKPEQTLEEGRYVLLSDMDRRMELDVEGNTGDIPNETNVEIWSDDAPSQYNSFDVVKGENGYYKLIHAASGKALDLYNAGTGLQNNISLHDQNGNAAQDWAIISEGGDSYVIWSRRSGMVMDVENAKAENGTNVSQSTYHGGANQRWYFVPAEYSVAYNLMGGKDGPEKQTKYYMADLTLSSAVPQREGYIFKGWNDSADLKGTFYSSGGTYVKDTDVILYAVWEKSQIPTLSVVQENKTFIATISNTDTITGYGFVYGKDGDVTLETPGRKRIAFTGVASNRTFSFNAAGIADDDSVRGYVTYWLDGQEQILYADPIGQ